MIGLGGVCSVGSQLLYPNGSGVCAGYFLCAVDLEYEIEDDVIKYIVENLM